MREIFLEELKLIQIEILDKVDEYCKKNGIKYFLSSGTLIGAIRHKGYIPWDDDIDIYMPRQDYERFIYDFNNYDTNYRALSLRNISNYPNAYAKVERKGTLLIEKVDFPFEIGINIDVFPVDGVPDDIKKRKKYFKKSELIQYKMILKNVSINFNKRNLFKNVLLSLGKLVLFSKSLNTLAIELDSMLDKTCDDTKNVCNMVSGNKFGTEYPRTVINDDVEVVFEGKMYKTMQGWDTYLKVNYGDYMQLPPEEKRISHHEFKAYWKL